MAYGMAEGTPHNVRMQLRGEPDQPGEEVPRGFIKVLGGGPLPPETAGSGRLELAQWLTRPDNPLTARVMVNRIWQYHFGRGLVKTPNDFGVRGLPPTHPELLDHLATRVHPKRLVGQGDAPADHAQRDVSASRRRRRRHGCRRAPTRPICTRRFPRRRLSAEEIRDSILAVSGELDPTPGTEHPFPSPISWGYTQHGPFSAVYDHNKRSVYLMTQRLKRHPFLALFDGADPNATTAERLGTTVPTQALVLSQRSVRSRQGREVGGSSAGSQCRREAADRAGLASARSAARRPRSNAAEAAEFLAAYRAELAADRTWTTSKLARWPRTCARCSAATNSCMWIE